MSIHLHMYVYTYLYLCMYTKPYAQAIRDSCSHILSVCLLTGTLSLLLVYTDSLYQHINIVGVRGRKSQGIHHARAYSLSLYVVLRILSVSLCLFPSFSTNVYIYI